mgnify:CR=1 FL=1
MGKKKCEERCVPVRHHYHTYALWTFEDECHSHVIQGVTSAAPNTPCHKHEYKGITSCNEGHTHSFGGDTGPPIENPCGHVHQLCGKTSCDKDHKHKYEGCTSRPKYC